MKLITSFLTIQNQLRVFHWQTQSYAQHKAFGEAYESLDSLIDEFIEVFSGKVGTPKAKLKYNILLDNFSEDYLSFIDSSIEFLKSLSSEIDSQDTDLLNIRDEMLAVLNKLKYLLTLK